MSERENPKGTIQGKDEEIYIDLWELLYAWKRKWWAILAAMLLLGVLFGAYCKFLVPDSYQADASLYITSNNSVLSLSDLQLSAALTSDYENIIKSRHVLLEVIDNLDLDISYQELKNMITVNNPSNSHIIEITVTASDEATAVLLANEVLYVSMEEIYLIIGSSEPTLINNAEETYVVNTKPSAAKYALIGAALGLVLVCGVITIRVLTDTSIKTEEDVEKWLGVPLIAVVPVNSGETGGAKKPQRSGGAV